MNTATRVVKVGGSLFDWPRLRQALQAWLNEQPPATNVLIAGGGMLVDAIRQAAGTSSMDDETSHWLCIEAMGTSARMLATLLSDAKLVTTFGELQGLTASPAPLCVVFDSHEFLREHEPDLPGHVLPRNWTVTSDSIAARLAEVLAADELVLLKSAPPPAGTSGDLAEHGYVDRHFPTFDRCGFRRSFVNLRSAVEPFDAPGSVPN